MISIVTLVFLILFAGYKLGARSNKEFELMKEKLSEARSKNRKNSMETDL
jgi:hypothetical protein